MFCPNCNQQVPEDATFCTNCGMRMQNTAAPVYPVTPPYAQPYVQPTYASPAPGYPPQFPTAKAGSKKPIIIISVLIGIAAIIVALFLALGGGANHNSPETVAEDFIKAYIDFDVDTMLDCMPEDVIDSLIDKSNCDTRDELEDLLEETYKSRFEYKNITISIEETDVEYITDSDSEFEECLDDIKDEYDLSNRDSDKIEECATVKMELAVTAKINGKRLDDTDIVTFYCVKIDSDWYVVYASIL